MTECRVDASINGPHVREDLQFPCEESTVQKSHFFDVVRPDETAEQVLLSHSNGGELSLDGFKFRGVVDAIGDWVTGSVSEDIADVDQFWLCF